MTPAGKRSLVITKTFAVPPQRLYDAWCRPELMAQWFFPAPGWRADVAAEIRPSGDYRVTMIDPEGGRHVQHGTYVELEPARRLVFTWTCDELGVADSLVTLEFAQRGSQTELTLTHELPDDPVILREHEGGWHGCLGTLSNYLEGTTGAGQ